MLAQLRPDARKQHRKLKRLGYIVIGPGIQPQNGVCIRIMTGQHQHRAFDAALAHPAAKFAPVGIRKAHIKDNQIVKTGLCLFHPLGSVTGLEHVKVFGHDQLLAQRFAQIVIVVDQQDLSQGTHGNLRLQLLHPTCAPFAVAARIATHRSRGRVTVWGNISISCTSA